MAIVYLGLGSNLGDRRKNIEQALDSLKDHCIQIEKVSTLIETDPLGGPAQGKFLNGVCRAKTDRTPEELLILNQLIEKKLDRVKTVLDGPRTIDIDILLYDRQTINTPRLTIPHPRMLNRDFVMIPLKEIDPALAQSLQ